MFDPYLDFQFDAKAMPVVWRVATVVLATVIAGLIVLDAIRASGSFA